MLQRSLCIAAITAVGLWLTSSSNALAQGKAKQAKKGDQMVIMTAADVKWSDLKVPGFDPGAQMAVLDGNPMAAGGVYTLRLKFPGGYRFPSHWHPKAEHLTVLSGSFQLGMGTTEDRASERTYGPGDFLMVEGHQPHYGGATTETIVQLHGVGPFKIILSKDKAKTKANH